MIYLTNLNSRTCQTKRTFSSFLRSKDPGYPHALFRFMTPSPSVSSFRNPFPLPSFPSAAPGSAEEGAAFSLGGVCSRWGWQGLAVLAGRGWNTGLGSWFLCGLVLPTPTFPPVPMSHCCPLMEAERQQSPPSCYRCCLAERACLRTQCRENST